MKEKWKP